MTKLATFFAVWILVDGMYIHKDIEWYALLFFGLCLIGILYEDASHVVAYTDKIRQLERRVAELESKLGIEKKQ